MTYPLTIARGGRGPTVFTMPSRFLTEIDDSLVERARNRNGDRLLMIRGRASRPAAGRRRETRILVRGMSPGGGSLDHDRSIRQVRCWSGRSCRRSIVGHGAPAPRARRTRRSGPPARLPHPGRRGGNRTRRALGRAQDGQPDSLCYRQQRHRGLRRAGPLQPQGLLHDHAATATKSTRTASAIAARRSRSPREGRPRS